MIIRIFRTAVCWAGGWCVQALSRAQLCNPVDYSPPGSSVHGAFQAGAPELHGLPCPRSGDLPDPGMESASPTPSASAGGLLFFFLATKLPGKLRKVTERETAKKLHLRHLGPSVS